MDRLSIDKEFASKALQNLREAVTAGVNTPEDANWYTILPISFGNILHLKRDLSDMEAFAKIQSDISVNMFKNPVGTLIFPASILANFNFTAIRPKDAAIISSMIRKKDVEINGKQYKIRNNPILIYNIKDIFRVKRFVNDLKDAEHCDNETVINFNCQSIGDFMAMSLHNQE